VQDPDAALPRLPAPASRALTAAGHTTLSQLAGVPVAELQKLHGMGRKAIRMLEERSGST
jgi:hypothetical protein